MVKLLESVRPPISEAVRRATAAEFDAIFNRLHSPAGSVKEPEFTPEERRTILSVLHPDNSASKERREAAFKVFIGKVKG